MQYTNTRLALERAGLGPVPNLHWHSPYLLTKAAAERAWQLFGKQQRRVRGEGQTGQDSTLAGGRGHSSSGCCLWLSLARLVLAQTRLLRAMI